MTGDTGEITQAALLYAIPSCVCVNPLSDHGTKSFLSVFHHRQESGEKKTKKRLYLSKLYETRKTELMLRDGNRS